jgi:hypothetical protein
VARASRDCGTQPRREEAFKFSTDAELVARVRDIVGLPLLPRGLRALENLCA